MDREIESGRNQFDIDNMMVILEKDIQGNCHGFGFASGTGDHSIHNLYHHDMKLLWKYVTYFKTEAASLMNEMSLDPVDIASGNVEDFYSASPTIVSGIDARTRQHFLAELGNTTHRWNDQVPAYVF